MEGAFSPRLPCKLSLPIAKIRNAELNKIPVMLILGEKEVESNSVSIRRRFAGNLGSVDVDTFISSILEEISSRAQLSKGSD